MAVVEAERFGLGPECEVEFLEVAGGILLRKGGRRLDLERWKGRCARSFEEMGIRSVDEYLDRVRGR